MPLTKTGLKMKHAFQKEYGKKKGTNIFYAFENKHKSDSKFKLIKRRRLKGGIK